MLKKSLLVIALSALTTAAFAAESDAHNAARQVIALRDGSTAYVFANGRMGVEDRFGHAIVTKPGTILQTADGGTITMVGDQRGYLNSLLTMGGDSGTSASE